MEIWMVIWVGDWMGDLNGRFEWVIWVDDLKIEWHKDEVMKVEYEWTIEVREVTKIIHVQFYWAYENPWNLVIKTNHLIHHLSSSFLFFFDTSFH